jgi:hypothetical protein
VAANVDALLQKQVVYDGEDYSRKELEATVEEASARQKGKLDTLAELRGAHEKLSEEMSTTEIGDEDKSAWERLLEKIPLLGRLVPERPLHAVLLEKVEVAQRRTQEVGNYLDRIQVEIRELQADIARLNAKTLQAARNEETAARHVLELEKALEEVQGSLELEVDKQSARYRELESRRSELRQRIWDHGTRLRLYSTAENRLAGIIRMNESFLEILRNLHGNMQALYEAGNEALSELEGNLAALASAARASELSVEMQRAMEDLRATVNKVATLASETSLYLTKNVDKLTSEMRIYDEDTRELIEKNLAEERDLREQRIQETVALAELELKNK